MSGNPENATVWPDADVYIGDVDAADPATIDDDFGVDWDLVGLLDGDAGFVEAREEEESDVYAWGGILVRTTRRNFKLTKAFTALEDNETTRALIWPGSTADTLVVPRPARKKVAFETREGSTVKRLITALYADVKVNGDITDSEADITRYELLATIFPLPSETPGEPATLFVQQSNVGASA
jgi:hypothetical protein